MHIGSVDSSRHLIFAKRKNVTFESQTAKPRKQLKIRKDISEKEAEKVASLTEILEYCHEHKRGSILEYASKILLIDPFNFDARANRVTTLICSMKFDRALCDVLVLKNNILAVGDNSSWKKIVEINKSSQVLRAFTLHIHMLIYMSKLKKVPPKIVLLKTLPDHDLFIDQIMKEYQNKIRLLARP